MTRCKTSVTRVRVRVNNNILTLPLVTLPYCFDNNMLVYKMQRLLFQLKIMASTFFANINPPPKIVQKLAKSMQNCRKSGSCLLWGGPTDRYHYGYVRVTYNGKRIALKVHRVAFYLVSRPLSAQMHVSHLCHAKLCINFARLSYEPQSVNNSRKSCKLNGECVGHRGYQNCIL